MSFLEKDYTLPKQEGRYMKLLEGENTFRVLSPAIVGWEWWEDTEEGRRPKRVVDRSDVPEDYLPEAKHFWAFVVYNYDTELIQILELTQRTIMDKIKSLVDNKKWGDPKEYDICITRTGKTMQDTNYSTMPEPKEELDPAIKKAYQKMNITLDALYAGEDPFGEERVDKEDIPV